MVPISLAPEPARFDAEVRQPGRNWLMAQGVRLNGPKPPSLELRTFWRKCIPDLRTAYSEICCYVCVWIPPLVGSATVDHLIAKSSDLSVAYEWDNYRLACGAMNSRKGNFDDILDPMELRRPPFVLEFVGMELSVDPSLSPTAASGAELTLSRLKLNDAECIRLRAMYWDDFISGEITRSYLQKKSPFVYYEACRQGLC